MSSPKKTMNFYNSTLITKGIKYFFLLHNKIYESVGITLKSFNWNEKSNKKSKYYETKQKNI